MMIMSQTQKATKSDNSEIIIQKRGGRDGSETEVGQGVLNNDVYW